MDAPKLEQAFLAALLRENNLIATAKLHSVRSRTFTDPRCRLIWETVCDELDNGRAADLVTVADRLPDLAVEIAEMEMCISTTVNFATWAEKLKSAEAKRDLHRAASEAAAAAAGNTASPEAIIRELTAAVEGARITAGGRKIPTLDDAAAQLRAGLIDAPPPLIPLFPEGTEGRRDVWLRPGEFFIIGARPGGGKTALCAGAVWEQLLAGLNVAYFCTESSTADILARVVAAGSGVPHYMPRRDQYSLIRFREILTHLTETYRKQLHIFGNDAGALTPGFIRNQLRAIEGDGAAQVVFVDFLQNLTPDRPLRSEREEINSIVKAVHRTLIDFRCAGIIVCQFNRHGQYAGGIPDMTWLNETSLLEQLAHTVSFLWRKSGEQQTNFYAAKTRNSPMFNLKLSWTGTKFSSAKIQQQPQEDNQDGNNDALPQQGTD